MLLSDTCNNRDLTKSVLKLPFLDSLVVVQARLQLHFLKHQPYFPLTTLFEATAGFCYKLLGKNLHYIPIKFIFLDWENSPSSSIEKLTTK